MNLTKYILPLGLLACVPVANDDTGELKVGDGEPSSEASSETSTEPPVSEFSPTFLGFTAVTGVDAVEVTGYSVDGQPTNGYFAAILANDSWSGKLDDVLNACYIYFDILPEAATFSEDFVNAGSFAGWTLDPVATFNTTSGACADLNAENSELVDAISQSSVGFGFGPLSASSEFEESIESTVIEQLGQEEWDTNWAPNVFAMSIHVESLTESPQVLNYAFAFEGLEYNSTDETANTSLPFDGASPLEAGIYSGSPWYIFPL